MKMFRLALVGILPAFVLLVAIQFSVSAAITPQSPMMTSWFTGDDAQLKKSTGAIASGPAAAGSVPRSMQ